MEYKQLREKVVAWGVERGFVKPENIHAQLNKIQEELGELCSGVLKQDEDKIVDSFGDLLVTIILGAEMVGYNEVSCLKIAYDEIKDRKGKTVNGSFVKEEDLTDAV